MYGSIRRYRIRSGSVEEIVARVKTGLVPLLEKTPGFVAYYIVDASDTKATSFTVADNRASIDEINRVALEWVQRNLPNQLSDPEVIAGNLPVALVHQHV